MHRRVFSAGLLLIVSLASVGCMVSPNHNQYLNSFTSKMNPAGFSDKPNTPVQFQAYDWDARRWVTVATTRSSTSSIRWDGRDWYYWQTSPVTIAQERFWRCVNYEGGQAKLRAVSNDVLLYTFEEWNWSPEKTLGNVGKYGPLEIDVYTINGPYKCWD